mmetsp:Transcript_74138/g.221232  ORF Transcript_74138/g.221232 Transcript_74138/m.221232 type:complete len:153 (-) Transcript_74138:833-1291(-)
MHKLLAALFGAMLRIAHYNPQSAGGPLCHGRWTLLLRSCAMAAGPRPRLWTGASCWVWRPRARVALERDATGGDLLGWAPAARRGGESCARAMLPGFVGKSAWRLQRLSLASERQTTMPPSSSSRPATSLPSSALATPTRKSLQSGLERPRD